MASENLSNYIEFYSNNNTERIYFSKSRIKIPVNFSSFIKIYKNSLSMRDQQILIRENDFFIINFPENLCLKILKKLHNQKYDIKFSIKGEFFNSPIFKLRNLEFSQFKQLLQILEKNDIFTKAKLNEFENLADYRNHTKNAIRFVSWALLAIFALILSFSLIDIFKEKYSFWLKFYYTFNSLFLIINIIFLYLNGDPSKIERHRKIYFIQIISIIIFALINISLYILAVTL